MSDFVTYFPGADKNDNAKRLWIFHEKFSKRLTVFSPQTVNIKKNGQFNNKH